MQRYYPHFTDEKTEAQRNQLFRVQIVSQGLETGPISLPVNTLLPPFSRSCVLKFIQTPRPHEVYYFCLHIPIVLHLCLFKVCLGIGFFVCILFPCKPLEDREFMSNSPLNLSLLNLYIYIYVHTHTHKYPFSE